MAETQNIPAKPSTPSGVEGFFSTLLGGAGELGKSAFASLNAAVPIWTANQLNLRSDNQLDAATFREQVGAILGQPTTAAPNANSNSLVIPTGVLLVGGGLIAAFILLR